jgi:hydroxyacylglutathione hydrolase
VLDLLQEKGLNLCYILITHHHPDHIGGMKRLKEQTGAEVFGPHDPRINGQDRMFAENETVSLPALNLQFSVLEVPGHTSSHIAFFGHGCLFCGDTLFSVGCGRLFEGSPAQMQLSLDKLAALPEETRVFCAHEYTRSNCHFALAVEPENEHLLRRCSEVEDRRVAGLSTVPSLLGEEILVNPFLRSRQASVVTAAQQRKPGVQAGAETLAVIRTWKDSF